MNMTTEYSKNKKIIAIFTINCRNFYENMNLSTVNIENSNFYYKIFLPVWYCSMNKVLDNIVLLKYIDFDIRIIT